MTSIRRTAWGVVLLGALSAAAAPPNYDALGDSDARLPVVTPVSPVTRYLLDRARVSSVEPRFGVPTFVWAARDPRAVDLRAQGVTPEQAARRVLFSWAELYRTRGTELAEASLVHLHDLGTGAVIASFERRVGGVPVFRDRLHVVMDQRLQLVALSGALAPVAPGKTAWRLAPKTAVAVALDDLAPTAGLSGALRELGQDSSGAVLLSAIEREGTAHLGRPVRARKVYFALAKELVPAWSIELDVGAAAGTSSEVFSYVISAHDGALLFRKNLTEADAFGYRVWADPVSKLPDDGPQGASPSPHPTGVPNAYQPSFIAPSLITLQNGPISTNDPWLPAGATETTGNNAEAYADLAAPDGFGAGDLRAVTTAPGTFDRVFDPTQDPAVSQAQQQAAITQIFYTVNFLHDWFYDSGFDEAAGNGQENNFGRGGEAADSIKAEGQDVGGLNNANMSTPADGSRPRMQMYIWTPAALSTVSAAPPGTTWTAGSASGFGPQAFNVTATAVLANDGTGASPTDGCEPFTNNVAGQIALVDRGNCTFAQKVLNAQNAGGVGVLILNNTTGSAPGLGGTSATPVTIAALSLTQADGNTLKAALMNGPVTLTLTRPPAVRRDGTVDNTIISHEWGHYLSNRLVSNAAGLSNQQGRGMGEGWSDFVALLVQVREEDAMVAANANFGGVYAAAAYADSAPGNDAYYFGIRRFPYSVDFTKNALTFKHIADGEPLPTGMPYNPNGTVNSEVHATGEVWATMLWECYVGLLRSAPRLTFAQARDRMRQYLVESLSMTPAATTFVEARDAMLAAAAANDLADFQVFAQAFARRGLGLYAVAPDRESTNNTPVVEDFSTGNELAFGSATLDDEGFYCDRDGTLDSGETGHLRITLKNTGFGPLSATTGTLSTTTPGVTIAHPSLTFTASQPYGVATAETDVTLTGATAVTALAIELTFTDPQLTNAGPRTQTLTFRANADEVPSASATDDAETSLLAWTVSHDAALDASFDWRRKAIDAMSHVYYGPDPASTGDVSFTSPPLQVGAGNFSFTFNHRFAFEASGGVDYDGAVLELSTDNGQSWTDIGASASPGYNGTLTAGTSSNPLAGQAAFVAQSAGYPAMIPVTVNLGATYAGQTVLVRFRIGGDQAAADTGWEIDDLSFTGIIGTPFPQLVADRGLCINRPPVANAGPDFAADERTMVTLSALASTDPDNDMLTATWTQVSGPAVTVTNGAFLAPEVTADTPMTFSLRVNDGTVDSANTDDVTVTIRQVNRAPIADAGAAQTVDERTLVTLAGSATDPDGDGVTFLWSQTSGPAATLSAPALATTTFVAPEVQADTDLEFSLVATDGTLASQPSTVRITVRQVNQRPTAAPVSVEKAAEGSDVVLTGVASDPDGDPLTWTWTQVAGPMVTLVGADTSSPHFTAPSVDTDTDVTFGLVVSDGQLSSVPRTVTVRIINDNLPPVVDPGAGQEVQPGAAVTLDGSASRDPEGKPLVFAWGQIEGSRVTLTGADTAKPTFTAPDATVDTALLFRLTVWDESGLSSTATTLVTVKGAPKASGCGCTSGSGGAAWALGLAMLALLRRRRA